MLTFYFLVLQLFVLIYGNYICNKNATVFLDFNEIAFFKTLDYPALINLDEVMRCPVFFSLKLLNQTNYRMIIGYTGFGYSDFFKEGYSFIDFKVFPGGNFSFPIFGGGKNPFIAQQGFVVFDDGTDNCPLESLSSPFGFKDETQILYLQPNQNFKLSNSCRWNFTSPEEYGFKIVIMNFHPNANILVTNSTDIIINKRSLKLNYPFYNNDNFIQINWFNLPINISYTDFRVSVSIVKKQFKYTDGNCTIIKFNNNTLKWTSLHYPYKGLNNYVWCTYNLSIPINTAVGLLITNWGLEKNVDILQYYRNINDVVQIDVLDYGSIPQDYILQPNYDGLENDLFFEFKSDGSIISAGFTVEFTFLECECNTMVSCTPNENQYIMGGEARYCGNMSCVLIIEPCPTGFGYINLYVYQRLNATHFLDVFKILSNGETVLTIDSTNFELTEFLVYLNSSNSNQLQAITSSTSTASYFEIFYKPFFLPSSDVHVILTAQLSYCIFDLGLQILPIIEISDDLKSKNLSFSIYRFRTDYILFSIFNNQSLTYNLNGGKNCFKSSNPYKCEINSSEIAMFQDKDDPYNEIVAVRLSDSYDGCFFSETVFSTKGQDTVNVAALADKKGSCDIILLNDADNYYIITSLWTTTKSENVKMFIGLDKKRLYFEFNSVSAKKWKSIGIMSRTYIIEIPKNVVLFLKLQAVKREPILPLNFPYQSMITTHDFGNSKGVTIDGPLHIRYVNVTMKFTALYYKIALRMSFYFQTSDHEGNNQKIVYINKTGDSVVFHDVPVVSLIYSYVINSDEAMFYIETLH